MNQPFDITTLSQNNALQLRTDFVFASMDDTKSYFRAYAKQQLFDIVVRTSNNGINTGGKLSLACFRQLEYRNTRKDEMLGNDGVDSTTPATKEKTKRNYYSNRDNCSFQIRLYRPKGSNLWAITNINSQHNHGMANAFTTFARHRQVNAEQTRLALYLIGSGCKNQAIVDILSANFPGTSVIAKDIYNMRRRFMGTSTEDNSSMYPY